MKLSPLTLGNLHFIGIGGIGMSGIAEILHNLGQSVQGSDQSENANTVRLQNLGVPVFVGHHAENIRDASIVIVSAAIKPDNPELVEAKKKGVPVVKRAEILAEIMRLKWSVAVAGSHGKTTTTSMVATLLDKAGLDPTVINGGVVNAYGTNARLGKGDWVVAEACESDKTFIKVPATVGVVTNIDPEHLEQYGTFEALQESFITFLQNIPFFGFGVLCFDHPVVRSLISKVKDRRLITYGFEEGAMVRAENARFGTEGVTFDVAFSSPENHVIKDLFLPMVGKFNVLNALAAITIAHEMKIDENSIRLGLQEFSGVKRRFTKTGEVSGVSVIDDYAHHPVEIANVLEAARQRTKGRVIAVMQPHRYSRLKNLFGDFCTCFKHADQVIITPVYSAGEKPIPGITRDSFIEGIKATQTVRDVLGVEDVAELSSLLKDKLNPGDLVICLGAGSITQWAHELPQQLEKTDLKVV